jgi:ABC-2 type transport system permease protein
VLLFVGIDRGGKSLDARGPELLSRLRRANGA